MEISVPRVRAHGKPNAVRRNFKIAGTAALIRMGRKARYKKILKGVRYMQKEKTIEQLIEDFMNEKVQYRLPLLAALVVGGLLCLTPLDDAIRKLWDSLIWWVFTYAIVYVIGIFIVMVVTLCVALIWALKQQKSNRKS